MYFLRRNSYVFVFLALLLFCCVMVMRQMTVNEDKRIERREAFILLHSRGYARQSERLYNALIDQIPKLTSKQLMDDFQRTMSLVDPSIPNEKNLIWKYHWTISNELEKRSEKTIQRALKLADE